VGALEVTKETEKISAEKPTVGQVSRRFVPPMWLAISAIVAVLLLSGGIAWWLGHRNSEVADTSNYTCSNETIKSASTYITKYDSGKYYSLVTEIMKHPTYKKDINCLYIVTRYYIMVGRGGDAQTNLNLLKIALPKSNGYSIYFNPLPMTLDAMQTSIDVFKQQGKELEDMQNSSEGLDQALSETTSP